jgi:hypothetical protein
MFFVPGLVLFVVEGISLFLLFLFFSFVITRNKSVVEKKIDLSFHCKTILHFFTFGQNNHWIFVFSRAILFNWIFVHSLCFGTWVREIFFGFVSSCG